MKAEHRKELETNALADRMGRLLQGARETPQRSTVWYFIFLIVAAFAVFIVVRWWQTKTSDNSESWANYYLQGAQAKEVAENFGDRPQGKAVKLDQYGQVLWNTITQLGADPKGKISLLRTLSDRYEELRKECESEPAFEAETMYAMAVIEETLSVVERNSLDGAIERFKELKKKHGDTAYGKFAAERIRVYDDPASLQELRDIYVTLQTELGIERKK